MSQAAIRESSHRVAQEAKWTQTARCSRRLHAASGLAHPAGDSLDSRHTFAVPVPCYQVNAFTSRPHGGNPALVCLFEAWPPDRALLQLAASATVPEVACLVPKGDDFELRWFAPAAEVDLCGHATLAAAHVLYAHRGATQAQLHFQSRSGLLTVKRVPGGLQLDFPARPASPVPGQDVLRAVGCARGDVLKARDYLVVLDSRDQVAALQPDLRQVAALDAMGVIVTAAGQGEDFVSRYFAPRVGIDEDPVTGSAHCTLAPYWAARLGKSRMYARQLSHRGGELTVEVCGDRVLLTGNAVTLLEGNLAESALDVRRQ
ncbi:MAG: PhzF family phenazine biosynthesis protein [Planctomycetes bacterium]|nr:PhzF family phenazine biosynthesis protein [Planctomycetota bacterium]